MSLTGRGDPTGRGRGFAFTREDIKKAKEEAAPAQGVKAQADGTITGEDSWDNCLGLSQDKHSSASVIPVFTCIWLKSGRLV